MNQTYLILDFALWYYTRAFRDMLAVWSNFNWFIVHFFSIPLLFKTLFSPWKRMTDEYKRGGIEAFFQTLVMNMMSRVLGALVRLMVILCGISILLLSIGAFFVAVITWICMPLLFVVSMVYGIMIFFV